MGASAVSREDWVITLDSHAEAADALSDNPGLCDDDVDELVRRIQEVLESRYQNLKGYRLKARQQVEITLVLLRHNISQAQAADMYGIS